MKKMILLLGFTLLCVAGSYAIEEYWVNIDFTKDKDDFPDTPAAGAFDVAEYGITGYINAYPISTLTLTNPNDENESFTDAVRMSRNGAQHLTFPVYDNIGTIRTYYFNTNQNIDAYVPILYNSGTTEEPVWSDFDPVVEILVKKNDDASSSARYSEIELNLDSPTQIRFGSNRPSNNAPNTLLYAVSISKYEAPDPDPDPDPDPNPNTSVNTAQQVEYKALIQNRTLQIDAPHVSYQATVYHTSGMKIGTFSNNQTFKFDAAGQYIVKLETAHGTVVKKLAVF